MTFLFSVPSCSGNRSFDAGGKVIVSKSEYLDSYIQIQTSEELDSICRYDDAIVMVSREGCQYCSDALEDIRNFVSEYHYVIYVVDFMYYYESYNSVDNTTGTYANLYPRISGTPTFLFYQKGKLLDAHSGSFSSDAFENEILNRTLDLDIYIANDFIDSGLGYYYNDKSETLDTIGYSTNTLSNLISTNENTVVLFTWRRCQDCRDYKDDVLYNFLAKEEHGPIYYYELDGYYLLKRSEDPVLMEEGLNMFAQFCQNYHLSDYPVIDILGNTAGVAPTIVSYYDGTYEINVFKNDFNPVRNEDGTISYSQSFYEEVLELRSNTKVADDTISDSYLQAVSELAQKAEEIEILKATEFLRNHL